MTITSTNLEATKIFIDAIIIIIAARDIVIRKQTPKWYKRVSAIGWILIVLAGGEAVVSVFKINAAENEKLAYSRQYNSDRQNDKKEILNGVETAFNKHHLSYNPITKTITIIDTSQKLVEPVMDIYRDSTGFFGKFPDSIKLQFYYECINKGIAYIRSNTITPFLLFHNRFYSMKQTTKISNTGLKAHIGSRIYLYAYTGQSTDFTKSLDTTYYFFKATYSDREVGGKIQPPLREIFYFYCAHPKSIKDFKLRQVDNVGLYQNLKDSLIKVKLW